MSLEARGDVGADCRHDIRPSVQFPNASNVESELGLTVFKPIRCCRPLSRFKVLTRESGSNVVS